MDPDRCFSMLLEHIAAKEWQEAADRAGDLKSWLSRGGFYPGGSRLDPNAIDAFLEWSLTLLIRRKED